MKHPNRFSPTFLLRVCVFICLILTAVFIGVPAYYYLRQQEINQFEAEYQSITKEALNGAKEAVFRFSQSAVVMATIFAHTATSDQWPNVTLNGMPSIGPAVRTLGDLKALGVAPVLVPEQVSSWEAFAYSYFESDPKIPASTGISSFGKGIFKVNPASTAPDKREHDTTGATSYNSPNTILTPLFHVPLIYDPVANRPTMFNWHSEPRRGAAIDLMIECIQLNISDCGMLTDFLIILTEAGTGIDGFLVQPIFAYDNPTKLVAIAAAVIRFTDVLLDIVPDYIPALDVVFSSATSSYTYRIIDGVPLFIDEGDHHDRKYSHYRRRDVLKATRMYSESPVYTMEIYPTHAYVQEYRSDLPLYTSLAAVAIIIFTSMVFLLYDYFMKKVSNEQLELLEAKRKFVRFISHEVRTPLNTISLGAKLLLEQLSNITQIDTAANEKYVECVDLAHEIQEGTDAAVAVLNDLIRYDEININVLKLEACMIPIYDLVETVKRSYDIVAREKLIEYKLEILAGDEDAGCHRVAGDEMQIMHALRSLLSNAFKHTQEKGQVKLRCEYIENGLNSVVKTSVMDDATSRYTRIGSVRIAVQDTGCGMSASQINDALHMTAPPAAAQMVQNAENHAGMKAAVHAVRYHGGSISIVSDQHGTTITFELPLYLVPCSTRSYSVQSENRYTPRKINTVVPLDQSRVQSLKKQNSSPVVKLRKVLVVDDAPSTRKILTRLLRNQGHRSVEAENGHKAVQEFINSSVDDPFDAILLDFEMPVMNGPTASCIIRELGYRGPIIGISGNVLPEDVKYFKNHGATGVLPKPLKMTDLENMWSDEKLGYALACDIPADIDMYRCFLQEKEKI